MANAEVIFLVGSGDKDLFAIIIFSVVDVVTLEKQ